MAPKRRCRQRTGGGARVGVEVGAGAAHAAIGGTEPGRGGIVPGVPDLAGRQIVEEFPTAICHKAALLEVPAPRNIHYEEHPMAHGPKHSIWGKYRGKFKDSDDIYIYLDTSLYSYIHSSQRILTAGLSWR